MREEKTQQILRDKQFRQKKSLGQHFLHDTNILREIVRISGADRDNAVLEIGPGAGTLTRMLSLKAGKVLSVEVDRSLEPVLQESLAECGNTQVKFADFLRVPWSEIAGILGDMPIRTVANIPYAITTDIVERLLAARDPAPVSATLLMQKEAAQRILAPRGSKEYGPLAVRTALYTRSATVLEVPPSAFIPPPHVDSAVLHMEFLPEAEWPDCPRDVLERLVKAAFLSRRKQLHNNLASLFDSKEAMLAALEQAGLAPTLRAEQIAPGEYAALARVMAR